MDATVRRLHPSDAPQFRRLRLEALQESPSAYGRSYAEEVDQPLAAFAEKLVETENNWVLGCFQDETLIAVLRLVREENDKERHKANIFGLYVAPPARKRGLAGTLLQKAIQIAQEQPGLRQLKMSVTSSNTAALALYLKAGFIEYGREEDSLFFENEFFAESYMMKKLRD